MPIFPEKPVFPIRILQGQLGVESRKQYIVSKKLLEIFAKKATSVKLFFVSTYLAWEGGGAGCQREDIENK